MECLLDILVQNMHGIIHRFCFDCCCKFVFFAATDFHNGISFHAHSSYGWMENIINLIESQNKKYLKSMLMTNIWRTIVIFIFWLNDKNENTF